MGQIMGQSYFNKKTLRQVTRYENNNRDRQKPKNSIKMPEENVEAVQFISFSLNTLYMIC